MKKVLFLLLYMSIVFMVSGCQAGSEKESDSKVITDENNTAKQNSNDYYAKGDGFNIIYDYDVVTALCNDICEEFARAVKSSDKADFESYVINENLQKYLQYRVDNHIFDYTEDSSHKFMITEVDFNDEYVLVSGITGVSYGEESYSLEGINHFLIKNENGRLYIADWYWDAKDSLDVTMRGEFSVENNLTYWDEPGKYEELLK
ncbi:MAG: hypothetical protein E7267_00120 [Lachnospiraceae bacterium]|nr:hypothetical protein [Lachnospiraceae bacterium]